MDHSTTPSARGTAPLAESKSNSYAKGGRGVRNEEGLTPRQAVFVACYLASPTYSATAAARAAGFSGPEQAANRLMRIPAVTGAIARRMRPLIEKLEITAENVLQGISQLAFGNIIDFGHVTPDGGFTIDLSTADRVAAGAIASIRTRTYKVGKGDDSKTVTETVLKLADRRPALEALARNLRLLGDKQQGEVAPIRLIFDGGPPPRKAIQDV